MAKTRKKVPAAMREALIREAGGKCANPGCTNWRDHVHHIKHWAVFQTHDAQSMIAICPACHDEVHHGRFAISDEDLYRWKGSPRPTQPTTFSLHVDPAPQVKVMLGTVCMATTNPEVVVFEFSNGNRLSFRVLHGDVLQVSVAFFGRSGTEILRVTDNVIHVPPKAGVNFDARAGRVRVTVPVADEYIPLQGVAQMRTVDPSYAANDRVVALDLEVLKPGLVRVQGCWVLPHFMLVSTADALYFCRSGSPVPQRTTGAGEHSVLIYNGPSSGPMFKFE